MKVQYRVINESAGIQSLEVLGGFAGCWFRCHKQVVFA